MTVEQLKRCWRNKKAYVRDLLYREKSYRSGTGGGVDVDLEKAISKGLSEMSEVDVKIARLLGKEASFLGLRCAERNVVPEVDVYMFTGVDDCSFQLINLPKAMMILVNLSRVRPQQVRLCLQFQYLCLALLLEPPANDNPTSRDSPKRAEELSKQLSTFDSVSKIAPTMVKCLESGVNHFQ
ncbi:hypothetical protein Y032_0058g2871 [Ancylostoma ceylanicum]|uniref:Uncharacterized protein n=1 Tax=Ancylostoma ceylanicum TaxID=53326 RepID=A0A016U3K7_9BILA|nr:hypothetical protein Y032_0058g2871 [Ancylostoma ceylanicum]